MLNPEFLKNGELARTQLGEPFFIIPNALQSEVAEKLHRDLVNFGQWQKQDQDHLHESGKDIRTKQGTGYTYDRKRIQVGVHEVPDSVNKLHRYLNSPPILNWMSAASGRQCDEFQGSATLFTTGNHISDHSDYYVEEREDGAIATRALTFNYYLTKDWKEEWGGRFIWTSPYTEITPSFNTLVMFVVGPGSMHKVEPVIESAQGKRLAFTGWFYTIRKPDASSGSRFKLNLR